MMMDANQKLEKVRRVYAFWGKFSVLYDAQDAITFLGRAKTIRSLAAKKLGLRTGDKVLEVACGSGRNFPYLIEAVGSTGSIVGFDYSQEMLNAAQERCGKSDWDNVKLVQGDAAQLSITEKDFAGVLSVLGISAVPDWERALKRCYDLLRPGGKLVVCDARLFSGVFCFLNSFVRFIYSRLAGWDSAKDIPNKMEEIFGNVAVENFNFGTFFIAVSVKN